MVRFLAALALFLPVALGCTEAPDVVATALSADAGDPAVARASGDASTGDSGCDLDEVVRNAGLPPEAVIVAATCQLPTSWLDPGQGVSLGEGDLSSLLTDNGPIQPDGGAAPDLLCDDSFGLWYYDDPAAPEHIILCPSLCEFVRGAVMNRVDYLGCGPRDGGPGGPGFSGPPPGFGGQWPGFLDAG